MPTTKTQPTPQADESKPKRNTTSAPSEFDKVLAVIKKAGEDGITLKALSEATGLRYRVIHNVTWRLEGSPEVRDQEHLGDLRKPDERKIQRVGEGRTVRYALAS